MSDRVCSIEGCSRPAKYVKTGWCQTHYHRWWRQGDPNRVAQQRGATGVDAVSWRGDRVTYYGAHDRVRRTRGPARAQMCSGCGGSAEQWAYDHQDPAELADTIVNNRGTQVVTYSPDPSHYIPLCRGCHVRFDRYELVLNGPETGSQ